MPRAEIWGPQRRSTVSSRTSRGGQLGECSHQHAQQDGAGLAATPNCPVQHAMVDLKPTFAAQTHHTKRAGYGSFSGSQNGSYQQDVGTAPNTIEKEWGECYDDRCKRRRQGKHKTFRGKSVLA